MKQLAFLRIPLVGLIVVIAIMAIFIAQPRFLSQIDLKIYDILLRQSDKGTPSPDIAIIDIDERSLKELGQWPWPRYQLARMVELLAANGAASINLDILFSEADRTSPSLLRQNLLRDLDVDVTFENLPSMLEDNDALLAEALKRAPAVLGAKFIYGGEMQDKALLPKPPALVEIVPDGAESPKRFITEASGVMPPLAALAASAPIGAIDVATDSDGIVRYVPLVIRIGDSVYPNLALAGLMRAMGTNMLSLIGGSYGLEAVRIKNLTIPVSPDGRFHAPFRGGMGVYPYHSAKDLLDGKLTPQDIEGKIIFVGTSAVGLMDIRATPFDQFYAGVEVHATTVDAILSNRFIAVPPWAPGAQAILILLVGGLCCFLFGLARPIVYLPMAVLLIAGTLGFSAFAFAKGLYLSPLYVLIVIFIQGLFLVFYRFWQTDRQRRFVQNTFGLYVSPEIVSRLVDSKQDLFAGEEREATIIFTDIRGFTSLSENLEPKEVVHLLNSYFTPMTAMIKDSGGTLDKFIGDALMAYWNAPVDIEDHPAKAVETALRIQENMDILNDELEKKFGLRLNMGVGLHTGPVFAGNMGSTDLLNYTIIGDSVNTASRLEGLTSTFGVKIVVSEAVRSRCPDAAFFAPLDTIKVKGKTRPIAVYEPMRPEVAKEREDELAYFAKARQLLQDGSFSLSSEMFNTLVKKYPDNKLYQVFKERIARELSPSGVSNSGLQ